MTMRKELNWKRVDVSSRFLGPEIELIHPLSETFTVYGGDDVVAAAREWAVDSRLMLVKGVPTCTHGLYRMPCPANCQGDCPGFDHTEIWVPAAPGEPPLPFLLAHPYVKNIPPKMRSYSAAHGLNIASLPFDGWYGHGTLPIRMSQLAGSDVMWPLEATLEVMLAAYPPSWPDDISNGAG